MLERQGIPATQLIGDLPIPFGEAGDALPPVEWADFAEFMKRLELEVGGPEGLEDCGARIGELKPARTLRAVAGIAASPHVLYRAAVRWALRRAMPGVEARIVPVDHNRLEIEARLAEGLRPCPQIFHVAAGGARALPGILGLADALVECEIGGSSARYRLTLPPSLSIWAKARRFFRTVLSSGSALHFLETQQLELHAQHAALVKAHEDLKASEERYRALTDAALDVLCEFDRDGRVVYASASVHDLLGYSPQQVIGSHFHLWIPRDYHALADFRFAEIQSRPPGGSISRELVTLHADGGRRIVAEISVRSYQNSEGRWRMVGILRDVTETIAGSRTKSGRKTEQPSRETDMERVDADRLDRMRRALSAFSGSPESPPARRHPLERSLEALLAALESLPETDDPDLAGSLARASESMARVVDGAMVRAEAGLDEPEWIEIRKLMESVRLSTNERSEADGPALHVELGTDASEVWGHHELLALALVHLVEHGRRGARPGERVEIRVGQVEDDAGTPSVEFRVGLRDAREGSRVGPRDGDDTGPGDDASAPGGLAEAIAIDVARAHHGELLIREDEDGRPIRCLRIPRPD